MAHVTVIVLVIGGVKTTVYHTQRGSVSAKLKFGRWELRRARFQKRHKRLPANFSDGDYLDSINR